MTKTCNEVISVGDYIIIQKQNYRKLLKFNNPNSTISLGKANVNLTGIEGCYYYSFFKLESKTNKKNREYTVEYTEEPVTLKDEIDIKSSGNDNRNIIDDGRSQKLTAADIEILKSDSNKASDIVETLITNSNTFHNKTEFSQEKYLKKKEKKYCEYIQILKPNLRMIAEIMYKLDPVKIQNIRIDTMSQLITLTNINSEGVHLLYDSGSNGLLAAAVMNTIGDNTNGKLVHMHPGNMSQKQALLAMNYSENQLQRCISVNVYSVLRQFYQGCDTNSNDNESSGNNSLKRKNEDEIKHQSKVAKVEIENEVESSEIKESKVEKTKQIKEEPASESQYPEPKKPKWHYDNIAAAELLKDKADSLVISCKEDPQNIFNELVNFIKPGRPFAVFFPVAEPLQNLYMNLKPRPNVAALKLTCNWMRNYQVLPERTHPEVTMNAASGFILSGYILK